MIFPGAHHLRAGFVVNNFPSAAFDTSQRRARTVTGQAGGPKAAPVVRSNLIQRVHDVIKLVGLYHRRRAGRSVKQFAEIIQRLLPARLLPDNAVGPKPGQLILIVKICSPPP